MTPADHAALIRDAALALGFQRVGFTPVGPVERHRLFSEWLQRGYAGEMSYLAERAADRIDPGRLFAAARTVVTVALSYAHADPPDVPADRLAGGARGVIARYARGTDYHIVLKSKLKQLADRLGEALGRPIAWLSCVDTAPLLEREAAQASGLGFIAKNTMLIAPGAGSYLVLGELLIDVEAAPAEAVPPRCGACRACLDACPTGAFVDAYTLDARRCISYLTIELTGAIPRELRPLVGDRIFGCDICQEVCPFNKSAAGGAPELTPRTGYGRPALARLLGLGSAQFRKWQRRGATRRVHRAQLQRNVAVALGNVGTPVDIPALAAALASTYPLVRSHVVWALARIASRHPEHAEPARAPLHLLRAVETDPEVLAELQAALPTEVAGSISEHDSATPPAPQNQR